MRPGSSLLSWLVILVLIVAGLWFGYHSSGMVRRALGDETSNSWPYAVISVSCLVSGAGLTAILATRGDPRRPPKKDETNSLE